MIINIDKCHPDAHAILTSDISHEEKRDLLAARKADKRIFFKDGECIHSGDDFNRSDGFAYCNDRAYSKKIALKQHCSDKLKKAARREKVKAAQDRAMKILMKG